MKKILLIVGCATFSGLMTAAQGFCGGVFSSQGRREEQNVTNVIVQSWPAFIQWTTKKPDERTQVLSLTLQGEWVNDCLSDTASPFQEFFNVKSLCFKETKLAYLSEDVLDGLTNLMILDCSHNLLTRIPLAFVDRLLELESFECLNLERNPLEKRTIEDKLGVEALQEKLGDKLRGVCDRTVLNMD